MKKRALSIILALTLCFTAFASVGFGAGRIEGYVEKVGNMLDNVATDAQKEVIKNASADAADNPAAIENEPWLALVNGKLLTEDILNEKETVYPYFMMRYIQNSGIDLSATPVIKEAIDDFAAADDTYNTADKGFKESIDMFDAYADTISAICERITAASDERAMIFADGNEEETVKAYARGAIIDVLEYVHKLGYSATGDDLMANYNNIMASDMTKKNAAIVIGKKLLKKVSTGLRANVTEYLKGEKANYTALFTQHRAALFSSDKDAAIRAAHDFAAAIADKVSNDAANYTFVGEIVDLMAERGVSPQSVAEAFAYTMIGDNGLDTDSDFQVVWYDLGLNRVLHLTDTADNDLTYVAPNQEISVQVGHNRIDNMLGGKLRVPVTGQVYVETSDERVTAVQDAELSWLSLEYDPYNAPATVDLTVYRGSDEAQSGDVYRYIRTFTVSLENKEQPPVEKSITVEDMSSNTYYLGDPVVIKGKAEGFRTLIVSVINANGETIYWNGNVLPSELENGLAIGTEGGNWATGAYTVTVGDSDAKAETTFTLAPKPAVRSISVDDISGEYLRGAQVTIKGASEGFAAIVISIVKPDNTSFVYQVVVPAADGSYAVTYTIPENAVLGDYKVIVGDNDDSAETSFTVVSEPGKKAIVKAEYAPKEVAANVGTAFDELGLPAQVTLVTEDGEEIKVDIDWTDAKNLYNGEITDIQTLVGTYEIPEGYVASGDVNGKVEVKVGLISNIEKKVWITTASGVKYFRGDKVTIDGGSKNFKVLVVSIVKPDGTTSFVYDTVLPDENGEYTVTYTIPEDAEFGEYTVFVGDNDISDSITFVVGEEDDNDLIAEAYTPTSITNKKTKSLLKNLGLPATVTLTARNGETVTAEIDWTNADFDNTTTEWQTLVGTYEIPEGYHAVAPVDGKVEVEVKLVKSSSPSSSSITVTDKAKFDQNNTAYSGSYIDIKGTTTYGKHVLNLVGPDGKVLKTAEITGDEFKNGWKWDISDLGDLEPGTYTINLRATANGSILDTYNFTIKAPITSEIFNKAEHNNYIVGYEDGTVRPEANISREEVTTILFRLLEDETRNEWLTESTSKFTDVESDRWSMTSIATLTKGGLLNGYEDNTFRPGNAITRAEFAALCARFALVDKGTVLDNYTDVSGHWAEEDIHAVSALGWFQGSDGKFRPDDKITRAEAVTVINRILGRDLVDKASFTDDIVKFTDLDEDAWYYAAVVEATNAHDYDITSEKETWTKKAEVTDWTSYEK